MDLIIDILEIGEIYEHTTFVDVSMLITYNKKYCKDNPFIILNALKIETEVFYDDGVTVSTRNTINLRILNETKLIPFNSRYLFLNVKYNHPGNISIRLPENLVGSGKEYLEHVGENQFVALLEHGRKNSVESIFKYMIIPYVLTILQQLVHRIKKDGEGEDGTDIHGRNGHAGKGTWISVAATLMLMDVALFFTFPETNAFTGAEMSLMLNFFLKLFGAIFAFYDYDVGISKLFGGFSGDNDLTKAEEEEVGKIHHIVDIIQPFLITLVCLGFTAFLYRRARSSIRDVMNQIIHSKKDVEISV